MFSSSKSSITLKEKLPFIDVEWHGTGLCLGKKIQTWVFQYVVFEIPISNPSSDGEKELDMELSKMARLEV